MATLTGDLTDSRRPQPNWRTIILVTFVALVVVALTIFSPQIGAPLALDLAVALVVLLWPTVGLYLLPGAVAFGSVVAVSAAGVHAGPTDALVAGLTLAWLYALRQQRYDARPSVMIERIRGAWRTVPEQVLIFGCVALYLLAVIASGFQALSRVETVKEILKWTEVLIVAGAALYFLRVPRQLLTLAWAIIAAGVLEAIVGCFQYATVTGDTVDRVTGTFDQPNPYGAFLNLSLPLALCLLVFAKSWRIRWLAGGAAAIIGLAAYFARSRGALLSIAVAVVVVALVRLRLDRIAAIAVGVLALLFGAAWYAHLLPQSVQARVSGLVAIDTASLCRPPVSANFSTLERLAQWAAGINMFLAHPVLGVGAGNYSEAYPQYSVVCWPDSLGHAHNYYINAAAETGAIGLVAFLALTVAMVFVGWRATQAMLRSDASGYGLALALGFFACIATVVVHNLVDNVFVHAMELQIAVILAALLRLRTLAARAP
ncbi:MAG TPA: O-antigen ligase family protein [Ktedonobacterales bacterium]